MYTVNYHLKILWLQTLLHGLIKWHWLPYNWGHCQGHCCHIKSYTIIKLRFILGDTHFAITWTEVFCLKLSSHVNIPIFHFTFMYTLTCFKSAKPNYTIISAALVIRCSFGGLGLYKGFNIDAVFSNNCLWRVNGSI